MNATETRLTALANRLPISQRSCYVRLLPVAFHGYTYCLRANGGTTILGKSGREAEAALRRMAN